LPAGATLVVKRGSLGASGSRRSRGQRSAPKVEVIDTIGAGDVFDAGYLASNRRRADLESALRIGISTASTAISTAPRRYK